MRIIRSLFFVLLLIPQYIEGQINTGISDVNFRLNNNQIIVDYNIVNSSPGERFTIALRFITETGQVIVPKAISGDAGKNVEGGEGKAIKWSFMDDGLEFSGHMKAVVSIIPAGPQSRGPMYALLSVGVPGLGGYFVEENKIRPLVTTVGTLGLLTYGIIEKVQANKYYEDYKEATAYDDFQPLYDKANSAQHRYFIATRVAAAVWIADIAWVYFQGRKNMKEIGLGNLGYPDGFTIYYVNNELQFGYRLTF